MATAPLPAPRPSSILLVDDDPYSVRILSSYLRKSHYQVEVASGSDQALELMQRRGTRAFDCVLTDYRMPGLSGLELLVRVREADPSLATILITAEGEKSLVAATLRSGASDFLEKPVAAEQLVRSVAKAVETTSRRRRFRATEEAIREVGRLRTRLQGAPERDGLPEPEVRVYAQSEIGGDFANYLPVGGGKALLLCGDISGHDLQAAFVSAYFQGMVRGLLAKETPVREIARIFNELLLREWNGSGGATRFSIAACFVLLDFPAGRLVLLNCGFPSPFLGDAAGRILRCEDRCQPLGWFAELAGAETRLALPGARSLCLYTDGLEDLAEAADIDPCSMVYRLLDPEREGENAALTHAWRDDVLALRLDLPGCGQQEEEPFHPLLHARYAGDRAGEIDLLQRRWERSLVNALDGKMGDRLPDILVCCREAVLNALRHGCGGDPARQCELHLGYRRTEGRLRLRVEDPGEGHAFDVEARIGALDRLREGNLGLVMIRVLSDGAVAERGGAALVIDFNLKREHR